MDLGKVEIDAGSTPVCSATEVCRHGQHLPTNVAFATLIRVCDIARLNAAYHNVYSTQSGEWLKPEQVRQGREKERKEMSNFRVFDQDPKRKRVRM